MVRIAFVAFVAPLLASLVAAAPIPSTQSLQVRQAAFQVLPYEQFQISDGVAGNAEAEAAAIFEAPFQGVDLATVDDALLEGMKEMRSAAENAETELFNPAIAAATGAEAEALQVGKIKNKVLKLLAFRQVINIQIAKAVAAGDDTAKLETSLADKEKKLANNIKTDVADAGQPSKAVV